MNNSEAQKVGHSKITTKRLLRTKGVPVLEDAVVSTSQELLAYMKEEERYVIKPADKGAGTGVRLIRRKGSQLSEYCNGIWKSIEVYSEDRKGIKYISLKRTHEIFPSFTYKPMLAEPYFNDDKEGFSSLRCTVIGEEVVEAVKRVNRNNITSNISSGGTAEIHVLNDAQRNMAIEANRAIGADYSGVDLLVCGGRSVIGEVNIGPFTTFGAYTQVRVGKALAEYAMKICEKITDCG